MSAPSSVRALPRRSDAAPRRLWAVLALIALFCAVGAYAPYLPLYYHSLGLDLGTVGLLGGAGAALGIVGAPVWGALSDRFGGSPIVVIGAGFVGASSALVLGTSTSTLGIVAGAALLAFGLAGVGPILDARVLGAVGQEGYGPLRAWGSIAYIASSWLTGVLIDQAGLRAMFVVFALSSLAAGLIAATLPRGEQHRVHQPLRQGIRLFRSRDLGLLLLGSFLTWAGMAAVTGFYGIRFAELGASAASVGLASAVGAAVEVPIMLRHPRLAARFGAERLLVAGAAILALRGVGASIAADPAMLVVLSGINGVGFALFLVGGVTTVARRAPPAIAATAQGILSGVGIGFAQAAGAALGGVAAAGLGVAGMFLALAVVGGVGAFVVALAMGGSRAPAEPGVRASAG